MTVVTTYLLSNRHFLVYQQHNCFVTRIPIYMTNYAHRTSEFLPGAPDAPTAPGPPGKPDGPGDPDAPGEPGKPVAPGDPIGPNGPGDPLGPAEPGAPVAPIAPKHTTPFQTKTENKRLARYLLGILETFSAKRCFNVLFDVISLFF